MGRRIWHGTDLGDEWMDYVEPRVKRKPSMRAFRRKLSREHCWSGSAEQSNGEGIMKRSKILPYETTSGPFGLNQGSIESLLMLLSNTSGPMDVHKAIPEINVKREGGGVRSWNVVVLDNA